jgi:isoquinoline 1-oxidoreductase subunit beta
MIGYTFPNLLIDHAMRNPHVPPGFWRGVNLNQNAIYLECFIDELAHATGKDPLELRREADGRPPQAPGGAERGGRARRLGHAGARRRGGLPRPGQTHGFGSYVAACAEVSVSDAGKLKVHRIVAATDLRPRGEPAADRGAGRGQSFVYGLSAALYGEMHGEGRRVEQTNFDTYPVLRMDEMPAVESS